MSVPVYRVSITFSKEAIVYKYLPTVSPSVTRFVHWSLPISGRVDLLSQSNASRSHHTTSVKYGRTVSVNNLKTLRTLGHRFVSNNFQFNKIECSFV